MPRIANKKTTTPKVETPKKEEDKVCITPKKMKPKVVLGIKKLNM